MFVETDYNTKNFAVLTKNTQRQLSTPRIQTEHSPLNLKAIDTPLRSMSNYKSEEKLFLPLKKKSPSLWV